MPHFAILFKINDMINMSTFYIFYFYHNQLWTFYVEYKNTKEEKNPEMCNLIHYYLILNIHQECPNDGDKVANHQF